MRVVVPFTDLSIETRTSLEGSEWDYETVDVSGDDEAYWRLLRDLWDEGETFVVVEHDIVLGAYTLVDLARCEGEWCTCPYPYFHGRYYGLGCAKFSDRLIARVPELMDLVGKMSDADHPPRHWCRLDAWIQRVLAKRSIRPCLRHDEVGHVSDLVPSHGCVSVSA